MGSLLKLTNNAIGRFNAPILTTDTSLTLVPGQGAKFPAIVGAGEHFPCTLIRASDGAIEIVDVTGRSSDILTITRAMEGTTALAFAVNDRVELRLTGGALQVELDRMAGLMTGKQDALGYVPYSASNPAGYVTSGGLTTALSTYLTSATAASTYLSKAGGTMSGALVLPAGSAGAPAIAFATGTGFYLVSAGVIGIAVGGVLVATISSAGIKALAVTQVATLP